MKVKVKEIKPNPFRDMDNYPINSGKIESLKESFKQSGFWDNVVARIHEGEIQLLYGHHRIEAASQMYGIDFEIDLIIKDLTDTQMVLGLIAENAEMFSGDNKTTMYSIRVARDFLSSEYKKYNTLEEARSYGSVLPRLFDNQLAYNSARGKGAGQKIILRFLGKVVKHWQVQDSLRQLKLIDEGILDKNVAESIPGISTARDFAKYVDRHKIPKENQKKMAEVIKHTSHKKVEDTLRSEFPEIEYKPKRKRKIKKTAKDFDVFLGTLCGKANNLRQELTIVEDYIEELGTKIMVDRYTAGIFTMDITELNKQIIKLLNYTKDEKSEAPISISI